MRGPRNSHDEELPADLKHLLLTGSCVPPKGKWSDKGLPNFRIFTYVAAWRQDELRELWYRHRDSLMLEWRGRGKPWAYRKFEKGEIGI